MAAKCSAEDEFWPVFKIMWKLSCVTLQRVGASGPACHSYTQCTLTCTHVYTRMYTHTHTHSLLWPQEHCPLILTPPRTSIPAYLPLDRSVFLLGMPLFFYILCLHYCQEVKQNSPLSGSPPGLVLLDSSTPFATPLSVSATLSVKMCGCVHWLEVSLGFVIV